MSRHKVTITFKDGSTRTGELFDVDLISEWICLTEFPDDVFGLEECTSVVDAEGHDLMPGWLERLLPHRREALRLQSRIY